MVGTIGHSITGLSTAIEMIKSNRESTGTLKDSPWMANTSPQPKVERRIEEEAFST